MIPIDDPILARKPMARCRFSADEPYRPWPHSRARTFRNDSRHRRLTRPARSPHRPHAQRLQATRVGKSPTGQAARDNHFTTCWCESLSRPRPCPTGNQRRIRPARQSKHWLRPPRLDHGHSRRRSTCKHHSLQSELRTSKRFVSDRNEISILRRESPRAQRCATARLRPHTAPPLPAAIVPAPVARG